MSLFVALLLLVLLLSPLAFGAYAKYRDMVSPTYSPIPREVSPSASGTSPSSNPPEQPVDYFRKNTNYQFLRVMNGVTAAMIGALCVIGGVQLINTGLGSATTTWGWAFLVGGPLGALVQFHASRLIIDVADAVIFKSKPPTLLTLGVPQAGASLGVAGK